VQIDEGAVADYAKELAPPSEPGLADSETELLEGGLRIPALISWPARIPQGRTTEQVQEILGADWLVYQDLEDLIWAVQDGNEDLKQFDTSCFSGEYVTGVEPTYLSELEFARSDEAKLQRRQAS